MTAALSNRKLTGSCVCVAKPRAQRFWGNGGECGLHRRVLTVYLRMSMFGPKSHGLFAFNTGWVQAFKISLVLQAVWEGDIPNGSGIANHCLDVKSRPCKTEKHGKFIHFYVLGGKSRL